ncbi:MAG TPA: histidine--tRNA ligase [Gemmatimonadales bacterium]|nr:histidine--tRNA ligase [Gemmatimonadales bacterium]
MQGQALPGFRDFYPDELALKNHIFATWREVARRYGFQEYDGPPLEPLELYTDKSGAEIVQQLYAFEDKGGRKVALRPEMTPTLARMVGAHAQALKKPIRWFSIPQLFRYERQQRGRLREHFQLNMDMLGEASPLADAELIAAAIDIMRAFGFGPADVQARVSDRRVLRTLLLGRGLTEAQLPTAFEVIDKNERVPQEALAEILAKVGIARREASIVFEVANLRSIETVTAALAKVEGGEEAGEPLRQAVGALEAMGLGEFIAVDLTIVRGLAYYTGIVFELFDTGKSLRAICGGGRYDGLLKALGGVDLPALGFGMGDVVLGELLKERGPADQASTKLDAFLIAVSGEDVAPLLKLAHQLRDRGVAVEYGLRPAAIRKQLELAAARGAPRAVIVGPDERAAGEVVVRDLKAGKEQRVPIAQLLQGSFD